MQYVLSVPKECKEIFPLAIVAGCLARVDATRCGQSDFHRPTYDTKFPIHGIALVKAAESGKLKICDQDGHPLTADEATEAAKQDGSFDASMRPGTTEPDMLMSKLLYFYTSLNFLNEWATTRSDVFSLADMPVKEIMLDGVDENGEIARGYYRATITDPAFRLPGAPSNEGETGADTGIAQVAPVVIPGTMPRTAIGKLAIKAAWKIECETQKRATAKMVIEKLQQLVEETTDLAEETEKGVKWTTTKGKQKEFDMDACGKALETWNKSRA